MGVALFGRDLDLEVTRASANNVDVLARDQEFPGPLVIDASRVYWIDMSNGRVRSTSLDGGAVWLHSGLGSGGAQLTHDATSLFFPQTIAAAGTIVKASKATMAGDGVINLTPVARNVGIAMGPPGDRLYFKGQNRDVPAGDTDVDCFMVQAMPPTKNCATVVSMPTSGGTPTLVAYLAEGHNADAFTTDDNWVYWTDTTWFDPTTPGPHGAIVRAPLSGGPARTLLSGLNDPYSLVSPTTGSEAGWLFWLEPTAAASVVKGRSPTGLITTMLSPGPAACVLQCIAVRNGRILTEQAGHIVSVGIEGGDVVALADPTQAESGVMMGIIANATHVYWSTDLGTILRLASEAVSPTIPGPPSGLIAQAVGASVTISWAAPTAGAPLTGYIMEAGSAPALANIASLPTGSTNPTFATSGVPNGTYYLRVRASNAAGASSPSNEVTLVVGSSQHIVPGQPSALSGTVNGSAVALSWTAPSAGATPAEYLIHAGSAPGLMNVAAVHTRNVATTFSTVGVPGGTYYVRVRAANVAGASAPSNEVRLIVGSAAAGSPGPPVALTASAVGTTVTLTWDAPVSGGIHTAYVIEAGSSPGLANLANVSAPGSTTIFSARDVPAGTYYVRVRARNGVGTSVPSNETMLVVGAAAGECSGALTASLTWDTGSQTGTPSRVDMDLHITEPSGAHVWGGSASGVTLHVVNDNTTGLGPETICAQSAVANGVYDIDVAAFDGNQWPTTATLSVTTSAGTVSFARVFAGPDDTTAQRVATATFPGGSVTEATGITALDVRTAADTRSKQ